MKLFLLLLSPLIACQVNKKSKNPPSKKVVPNDGMMEERKGGILDEKHINNPALFQHSNIPLFQPSKKMDF